MPFSNIIKSDCTEMNLKKFVNFTLSQNNLEFSKYAKIKIVNYVRERRDRSKK